MQIIRCDVCSYSGFATGPACPECGAAVKRFRPKRMWHHDERARPAAAQVESLVRGHLYGHGSSNVERLTAERVLESH